MLLSFLLTFRFSVDPDAMLQVKAFAESGQAANGQDLVDILRYIVHERSSEKTYENGIRDKGRGSVALAYFLCHNKAQVRGSD